MKLCECGCGQPTNLATVTSPQMGYTKGQPFRFLRGHNARQGTLTGQTFGRLTVLESRGSNKHGFRQWLCVCECGAHTITLGQSLRNGNTRSCGCMSRQARFAERERNQRWLGDDASDKVGRDRARRWFADTGTCSRPNCSRVAERHHIDGNTRNNAAENIAFLCHAHHMQVELGGKPKPEDMRRKISATLKGRKLPAAHRAAVSEGVRQWWARRKMVVDA